MPNVLVPLIDGFEETEAIAVIDILRRAGIRVITAGVGKAEAKGSHDIVVRTDALLATAMTVTFDAVVLPGGPGVKALNKVEGLHEFLRVHAASGKVVAAICAAPMILAEAGLLGGREATCYPSVEDKLTECGALLSRAAVVEDDNIITSRGVGTAVEFGLALAARLAGADAAQSVAQAILHEPARTG